MKVKDWRPIAATLHDQRKQSLGPLPNNDQYVAYDTMLLLQITARLVAIEDYLDRTPPFGPYD